MAYKQWRTDGGWGSLGINSPPIDDLKKNLKRSAFFRTEFAEIAVMFFCAIQLAY